jgi:16S rRNA processing protein RimM
MHMTSEKLVKVAAIIDAHGIKGEVKLRSFVENEDLLTTDLLDSAGTKHFSLKITGSVKDSIIARIDGVSDRNAAEAIKGTELFLPESAFPELEEGELYHNQLIGLEVRAADNQKIGIITAIHNYGAGDIMEIAKASGDSEMLPFSEQFVGEVNIGGGYVLLKEIDYI